MLDGDRCANPQCGPDPFRGLRPPSEVWIDREDDGRSRRPNGTQRDESPVERTEPYAGTVAPTLAYDPTEPFQATEKHVALLVSLELVDAGTDGAEREVPRVGLPQGSFTIGRKGGVPLRSARVSGSHATLRVERGSRGARLVVTDTSSNGTSLDGQRLAAGVETVAPNGSVLDFAGVRYRVGMLE
jgi:hypothetical protein